MTAPATLFTDRAWSRFGPLLTDLVVDAYRHSEIQSVKGALDLLSRLTFACPADERERVLGRAATALIAIKTADRDLRMGKYPKYPGFVQLLAAVFIGYTREVLPELPMDSAIPNKRCVLGIVSNCLDTLRLSPPGKPVARATLQEWWYDSPLADEWKK